MIELTWAERIPAAIAKAAGWFALYRPNEHLSIGAVMFTKTEVALAKALWDRHSLEERERTAPNPALRAFIEKVERL